MSPTDNIPNADAEKIGKDQSQDGPEGRSIELPPMVLCPYCGSISNNARQCSHCRGLFEPLSRQATQNAMGPWQLHDPHHPYRPGCSFAVIRSQIARGKITGQTILRGPSTMQFWSLASRTPGVANLLGVCHACGSAAQPSATSCSQCSASFVIADDRQQLGLGPVRAIPGQPTPVANGTPNMPAAQSTPGSDAHATHIVPNTGESWVGDVPTSPAQSTFPTQSSRVQRGPIIAMVLCALALGSALGLAGAWMMFGNKAEHAGQPADQTGSNTQAPTQALTLADNADIPTGVQPVIAPAKEPITNTQTDLQPDDPRNTVDAPAKNEPDTVPSTKPVNAEPIDQPLVRARALLADAQTARDASARLAALDALRALLDEQETLSGDPNWASLDAAQRWSRSRTWATESLNIP